MEKYPKVTESDYGCWIAPYKFTCAENPINRCVEIAYKEVDGIIYECTFEGFKELIWPKNYNLKEQSPPQQ